MKHAALVTFAIILGYSFAALAIPDRNVFIPQIPPKSRLNEEQLKKEVFDAQGEQQQARPKDYQSQIMNDPTISDFGRANSFIQIVGTEQAPEGNTAIIHQEGGSNSSVIVQKGKKNKAIQKQKGEYNRIYLEQQGDHNSSKESQTGKHNYKRKIQTQKNGKFDIEQ